MPFVIIIWLLFGVCAAIVSGNRGANGCLWFGLGVLLGPIGFALAFATGVKCPMCASRISEEAKVCPNCGHSLKGTDHNREGVIYTESELKARAGHTSSNYCAACDVELGKPVKACLYCGRPVPNAGHAGVGH